MFRYFKLIILVNVMFVALFVFFNWVGYKMFDDSTAWVMQTHFPFYIYGQSVSGYMVSGFTAFILPNYLLVIFLISTSINLYFFFKLQRSKEKTQPHNLEDQ